MIEGMNALRGEYSVIELRVLNAVRDFSSLLIIDPFNLEIVCERHPEYFWGVSEVWADSMSFFHRIQAFVKETEATVALRVREKPEDYGLVKATESSIGETVRTSQDMKDAQEIFFHVEKSYNSINALLNAWEHRRSMINNAVQLHLSGLGKVVKENNTQKYIAGIEKKGIRRIVKKDS